VKQLNPEAEMLIAEQVALEVIVDVRPLLEAVGRKDRSLFDQARRAASSVVLNIAEGYASCGGNARLRYATAAGSANELSAALRVAVAWRYIDGSAVQGVELKLERVRRLLWGLRK